ncbi:SanA/YdcF family protein [Sulfuriroseicoccus oceanibius]|uniref:YdcF family protein n=1 Tax=Sulfuriroseicoccus oceanibius TaxID=2707525 RepID=A0A7T7EZN9_9BACT|nr:ElyC/SanA/YdcF family protein [Sulfuriroseicoccus oceanibius]QQL44116.1 YdcF family protein [Sulfuriroseicoccus oceanibius]
MEPDPNELQSEPSLTTPWRRRWWFRWGLRLLLALVLVIVVADVRVRLAARGRLYDSASALPDEGRVALVLGCSPLTVDGRPNLFFETRMDRAAELWHSGKVRALILSGDNSERYYNEPAAMRAALLERGVPKESLVRDFAGFRTLDSVVRSSEVFGQCELVIVSQRFHNQRAITIARHHGIDAVGVNASAVHGVGGVKVWLRERLARVKLLLDLYVLRTEPRFLGEPVEVPPPDAASGGR